MSGDLLTPAELHAMKRRNKYGARRVKYAGQWYDSAKEARYAQNLDLLKQAGAVLWWDRQVKFDISVGGLKMGYVVDFAARFADNRVRYFDIKGMRKGTPYRLFRVKCALMKRLHGIVVEEV